MQRFTAHSLHRQPLRRHRHIMKIIHTADIRLIRYGILADILLGLLFPFGHSLFHGYQFCSILLPEVLPVTDAAVDNAMHSVFAAFGGLTLLGNLVMLNGLNETASASSHLQHAKRWFLCQITLQFFNLLTEGLRLALANRSETEAIADSLNILYGYLSDAFLFACYFVFHLLSYINLYKGLAALWRDFGGADETLRHVRRDQRIMCMACGVSLLLSVMLELIIGSGSTVTAAAARTGALMAAVNIITISIRLSIQLRIVRLASRTEKLIGTASE